MNVEWSISPLTIQHSIRHNQVSTSDKFWKKKLLPVNPSTDFDNRYLPLNQVLVRNLYFNMKKKLLTALQYLLFLGFGIFLVWWSISKMDEKNWNECKEALKSAWYALFIPVFFILTASHISRAIRWKILMKPMGYNPTLLNTFFAVMIGYLANVAVPRLGEVLKCTILGKYEEVPPDKLVGTILVERAVDVFCLLLVFIIAIVTQAGIISEYARDTLQKNFFSGGTNTLLVKLLLQ